MAQAVRRESCPGRAGWAKAQGRSVHGGSPRPWAGQAGAASRVTRRTSPVPGKAKSRGWTWAAVLGSMWRSAGQRDKDLPGRRCWAPPGMADMDRVWPPAWLTADPWRLERGLAQVAASSCGSFSKWPQTGQLKTTEMHSLSPRPAGREPESQVSRARSLRRLGSRGSCLLPQLLGLQASFLGWWLCPSGLCLCVLLSSSRATSWGSDRPQIQDDISRSFA